MIDSGGPVPGGPHVPLHICVVGEQLTLGRERNIVFVPEATADQFPLLTLRVCPANPAPRSHDPYRMAAGVPHAWQNLVLLPIPRNQ